MKILQVINSLGTGGAEKLLLDTIPLYNAAGIEMDILLLWNNEHQFTDDLKKLNCCKVYINKESESVKDIYKVSHIIKIAKVLKKYDIAHVHLFPAQYFVVLANIVNGNKTKLIFTEHNTTNSRIQRGFFKPIEKFIYKRYRSLVCISNEINLIYKNYLEGITPQVVINNGVNVKKILNTNQIDWKDIINGYDKGDKVLIQVSAFRAQKDQRTLIKSLTLLSENYKLVLVGAGVTRIELLTYVEELNLSKRVFFLGQRMDVFQLIRSANIVVLSSNYEGLSLASIEGMASGRPFVASDVPGLSEIVGGAGILFELGNAVELAAKIQELLGDKTLYETTVKACQLRASQYDIQIMVDKHIELYESIC